MARTRTIGAAIAASAFIVACADSPETTGPSNPNFATVAAVAADQATDARAVAQKLPSFGGMYVNEAGTPVVYVTDLADAPVARKLVSRFAEEQGHSPLATEVVQARHAYTDLERWYNRTWPEALAQQGVHMSDLDEANNRLMFAVDNAGRATAVHAIMRARGVPADAYVVEVREPMENKLTLRDVVNPKVGGLQINYPGYLCTLGFNYTMNGVTGFITNSHCTSNQGGAEGTVYYQPTSTAASAIIADEVADPTYFSGGVCPKGKLCRYSDSSRAVYRSGVVFTMGGVASVTGQGSLTLNGTINLTSENDANRTPLAVGQSASKVGRTTGLSTGNVTNTCVNTAVSRTKFVQLCQTFVAAAVNSGDSGSPVWSGNTLVGILWGGGTNSFAFSPLRSIKDELGNFTAH